MVMFRTPFFSCASTFSASASGDGRKERLNEPYSSVSASKSENPNVAREVKASKVDPLDENFEHTLSRKVDREWCLAALKGAERLTWFRQAFPGYEDIFPHTLIASFLGITPVTMSRLRTGDKH